MADNRRTKGDVFGDVEGLYGDPSGYEFKLEGGRLIVSDRETNQVLLNEPAAKRDKIRFFDAAGEVGSSDVDALVSGDNTLNLNVNHPSYKAHEAFKNFEKLLYDERSGAIVSGGEDLAAVDKKISALIEGLPKDSPLRGEFRAAVDAQTTEYERATREHKAFLQNQAAAAPDTTTPGGPDNLEDAISRDLRRLNMAAAYVSDQALKAADTFGLGTQARTVIGGATVVGQAILNDQAIPPVMDKAAAPAAPDAFIRDVKAAPAGLPAEALRDTARAPEPAPAKMDAIDVGLTVGVTGMTAGANLVVDGLAHVLGADKEWGAIKKGLSDVVHNAVSGVFEVFNPSTSPKMFRGGGKEGEGR